MPQKRGNRWHYPSSMVTLTYSTKHRPSPEKWKRDRDAWLKRFRRRYPKAVPIWAREYTKADVIHFHVLVWWGITVWTESWKDIQAWISKSWADVITYGKKDREAYLASLKAGTQCLPVKSKEKVREYLAKGGSEKAHPGSIMAGEMDKKAQKSRRSEGEGRWWGIGNRAAYNRAKRIYIVILTVRDAARLAVAIRKCWLEYLRRLGIVIDPDTHVPQWVAGRIADELLQAEGLRNVLFTSTWIDAQTGEVIGEPVEVEAPSVAVAAGGEAVQVAAVSPPAPGPRVIPALWMPAGSPPLPSVGPRLVKRPGAGPSSPGPSGPVLCRECNKDRGILKAGLCIFCEPGLLPPSSGRKAPARAAKPRREAPPSLFGPGAFR